MANADIEQKFEEASLDADSLAEFVNGDDLTTVTTRLGQTYPTSASIARTLLEQGTIDATLFETKAELDADTVLIDGNFALVYSDSTINNNGYYQKESGVWVYLPYNVQKQSIDLIEQAKQEAISESSSIASEYTDSSLDFKEELDLGSTVFAIKDSSGRAGLTLDSKSQLAVGSAKVGGNILANDSKLEYAFAIADDQGNPSFIIKNNGGWHISNVEIDNLTVGTLNGTDADIKDASIPLIKKPTGYTAEINGICSYGQSLGMGSTSTPVISSTQNYDNLMFNSGVRTYDGGTNPVVIYANLTPLVESQTNSNGETPISGMADNIKMLIESEDGINYTNMTYRILGAAPAQSGAAITTLSKGTSYFNRLIDHIKYGALRAADINSSYAYQATTWLQGEADYSSGIEKDLYKTLLNSLVTDVSDAVIVETNQTFYPEFIIGQVGSHLRYAKSVGVESAYEARVAQAQLELSIERDDIHMACPAYFNQYSGSGVDQVHLTATDERVMGAYFGLVYKRVVIDGKEWQPLRPISITRSKRAVYITLNNESALNIDTTFVAANTDYGFRVFDNDVQVDITSVSIVNNKSIKIFLASDLTGVMTVDYALATDSETGETGRLIGARGNIRDSQGDTIIFDPMGVNRPLHNWLVMFTYNEELSKWL